MDLKISTNTMAPKKMKRRKKPREPGEPAEGVEEVRYPELQFSLKNKFIHHNLGSDFLLLSYNNLPFTDCCWLMLLSFPPLCLLTSLYYSIAVQQLYSRTGHFLWPLRISYFIRLSLFSMVPCVLCCESGYRGGPQPTHPLRPPPPPRPL